MGRLHFYKSTNIRYVSKRVAEIIDRKLEAGQPVLWLLSGGSTIALAAAAARHIKAKNNSGVTIGLIDERYGPPGHPDSNWTQLQAAGLELDGAKLKPVLNGLGFEETAKAYDDFIRSAVGQKTFKIGMLGIGADGHIAGLLPGSPAIDSLKYVENYQGPDYQRITLTGRGIKILDKAVVYAAGDLKSKALLDLTKVIDASRQPAQLLKTLADVDVYNDVIGDSI